MSTMREQLTRLVKSFKLVEGSSDSAVVPPNILENARAVMYFKKLSKGKQSSSTQSHGLMFKRLSATEWSPPVCVTMAKGDVYWGKLPSVERSDVMLVLCDTEARHVFELYGQVGFTDDGQTHKLKKGILAENSDAGMIRFAEALSTRPDLIRDDDNLSFGLCDGRLFAVHIESPVIRVRDSSTFKFYNTRGLTTADILDAKVQLGDEVRRLLVADAHARLNRYFDVQKQFPTYAAQRPKTPPAKPAAPDATQAAQAEVPTAAAAAAAAATAPTFSTASSTALPETQHPGVVYELGRSHGDSWGGEEDGLGAPLGSLGSMNSRRGSTFSVGSASGRLSTLSMKSRGSSLGGWDDADESSQPGSGSGADWGTYGSYSGKDWMRPAGEENVARQPLQATMSSSSTASNASKGSDWGLPKPGAPLATIDQAQAYPPMKPEKPPAPGQPVRERTNSFDFATA